MSDFFYRPADGVLADVIPFYEDGEFKLLYLKDWRDKENFGEGTPWFLLGTKDFVNYTEYGEVLPRGGESEQDLYIYTGCILKVGELYHIFYTGNNFHYPAQGKLQQAVMHATSTDLLHWTKLPEDAFYAPADRYEQHDWRDPFVFWNEEAGEYWMLLAARLKEGPSRRRGCVALCASKDLSGWEVREPFWAPSLYTTHECPDLFRMGDWWYLVYSTFSDRTVTHYRMSKSLAGPWLAPENDTFDNRAFYAAKTWTDGERRYAFGWNPTREGEHDEGTWQWGGNLVVHELAQQADGSLTVRMPETVRAAMTRRAEIALREVVGRWEIGGEGEGISGGASATSIRAADAGESSEAAGVCTAAAEAPDSFAAAAAASLPSRCRLSATVTFGADTRGCGVLLRTDAALDRGYMIRLEPGRQRLVFDRWPRKGDVPFEVGLERPVALTPGVACRLDVVIDGTVCEVYVDDTVAMSARLYDHREGGWGLFVSEGSASFETVLLEP
ncbi:glycoside hydrolase family 32 protein [Cohnella hashimotonis]|uniref:beta-fructofuranosidase n=1 Tax=Cohnella hashimotonis TaxID=2826895 RepID=A0ABT6TRH0_9BACL|nr:glycoside hydrolase family 32 protein [Cohnella hashimotonis]MDI4648402.1 glycoside hydrolase family 32 protein [Cohnella hashimotonis]